LKYLQQLSAYRIHQRNLIMQLADSLSGKKDQLAGVRKDKSRLLTLQQKEKNTLTKEKKEQMNLVTTLASKEKKLKSDLREKQKQEARLSKLIENAIRKEIEAAQAAAKKRAAAGTTASVNKKSRVEAAPYILSATPEAARLSSAFENNRGKLPWPVEQGFISSSYGRHAHPVWKDVVVNNSGIDINSSKGAKVRSVFEGKVSKVIVIMNKYAVIIQHGEYFTVYSNLRDVNVKSGDVVTTKQVIGTVQTDDEGKSEVHLEIWKGSSKMDPEAWITARR
jgi:septal ring factor EnvC (AmiA/AmiB activator)